MATISRISTIELLVNSLGMIDWLDLGAVIVVCQITINKYENLEVQFFRVFTYDDNREFNPAVNEKDIKFISQDFIKDNLFSQNDPISSIHLVVLGVFESDGYFERYGYYRDDKTTTKINAEFIQNCDYYMGTISKTIYHPFLYCDGFIEWNKPVGKINIHCQKE